MRKSASVPPKAGHQRFDPPANQLLYQAVITSIFQSVIEGRVKPGERLVESSIAEELNVSRSPIRQALQEMARQGIVTLIPRVGASVATWSTQDIEDFCRLRVLIEALAAEQAAVRIEESETERLAASIERMSAAATEKELEDLTEIDLAFHKTIAHASHSVSLVQTFEAMILRIRMFMIVEKYIYPHQLGNSHEESAQIHEAIFEALCSHEADLARSLMEQHIRVSAEGLVARMKSHSVETGSSELPPIVKSILRNHPQAP